MREQQAFFLIGVGGRLQAADDRVLFAQVAAFMQAHSVRVGPGFSTHAGLVFTGTPGHGVDRIKAEAEDASEIFSHAYGWTEKVEGIDAGADDYVLKPFHVPELLSRLHAVLRRSARQACEEWTLGTLRIAPRRHEAWQGDALLALSPREFRLLVELAREPGTVVAKNVLAQRLEPLGDALDAATLEVHISNLRKKIGAQRVVTVRGVGYRLQP